MKKGAEASGSANKEEEYVALLPQYKKLDELLSTRHTTNPIMLVSSVGGKDLGEPGSGCGPQKKAARLTQREITTAGVSAEMQAQTELMKTFIERSYETQQRIVTALESQTKSFADYLNFIKSREPARAPASSPFPPAASVPVAPAFFDPSGTPARPRNPYFTQDGSYSSYDHDNYHNGKLFHNL